MTTGREEGRFALYNTLSLRFVLVHTSHPGNIGAAARAIKTMGFQELVLVAPEKFPDDQATAMAAGAADVLEKARVCATLEEALADCAYVVGTSARTRTIPWTLSTPRASAPALIFEAAHILSRLFSALSGQGLTNADLQRCHHHLYVSNASGVHLFKSCASRANRAYELMLAEGVLQAPAYEPEEGYATASEIEAFYDTLKEPCKPVVF